jgi:hypothetical protein
MNVIRHQTVAKKPEFVTSGLFAQQMEISAAGWFGMKDGLLRDAAVRDVVRLANGYHSTDSAHAIGVRRLRQDLELSKRVRRPQVSQCRLPI